MAKEKTELDHICISAAENGYTVCAYYQNDADEKEPYKPPEKMETVHESSASALSKIKELLSEHDAYEVKGHGKKPAAHGKGKALVSKVAHKMKEKEDENSAY